MFRDSDRMRVSEPGGTMEKHFKPVFREKPEDAEVREGMMVRFDCLVTGRPHPDMLWFRDGVQVHDDNLHKVRAGATV